MVEKIVVNMTYKKSTKGTHVYENTNDGTPIPTLYIKKIAMHAEVPTDIVVTIEAK